MLRHVAQRGAVWIQRGGRMRIFVSFVCGALVGAVLLQAVAAQTNRMSRLNHVGIVVDNYDEALEFYTGALGLRVAYTVPKPDGSPLLTYLQLNRETFIELIPVDPGQQTGITHFGIEFGDLESAVGRLREHRVTVADPGLTPAKALYTRIRDLDNVDIEIMEFGPEAAQRKAMDAWR
jgi:catechol 2,3-dioxygenase-like lactoylglutathione lyase family enzyme